MCHSPRPCTEYRPKCTNIPKRASLNQPAPGGNVPRTTGTSGSIRLRVQAGEDQDSNSLGREIIESRSLRGKRTQPPAAEPSQGEPGVSESSKTGASFRRRY